MEKVLIVEGGRHNTRCIEASPSHTCKTLTLWVGDSLQGLINKNQWHEKEKR